MNLKSIDGVYVCPDCSVVLRIKETREYLTPEIWGVPWILNVWECINCSRTWWVWQGPKSEEPKPENLQAQQGGELRMTKKGKRIKELEERVETLERARSIYNEHWQTSIVELEQRIEILEARPTGYWYPPQPYGPWQPYDPWQPYSPTYPPYSPTMTASNDGD